MKDRVRINNFIRVPEVRVIDEEGKNLGVIPTQEANKMALDAGLDLIEISPNAVPPIAKIMDFGKYQYLENKKQKLARTKTQMTEVKGVQIGIATGDHDLEVTARKASEFLAEGNRVKVTLTLRGRAKYMDKKFLRERVERLLKLITEKYRVAEDMKPGPRGLMMMIEKSL